jgi:O-antigen ligase
VTSDATATRFELRGASLLLAGGMCLIPFLQPLHFPPLRTFYDEWLAFSLGVAAIGFVAAARRGVAVQFPALSLCLGLFALTLVVRALSGDAAYTQLPLLWSLYALFAALLVVLGNGLATQFGRDRVCDMLAAFLLTGALANSVAGVLQVVGIPRAIDAFISHLHGTRAIGNVGQANLYANYLALGGASLVYLFARGKIARPAAIAAGLLLLCAAALAASRSSFLYLGYFALLGWFALRLSKGVPARRLCNASIALAITGLALHWLVPAGLNALGIAIEGGFHRNTPAQWASGEDATLGLRLQAWELAWRLFAASPWFGVGPGEFSGAAFAHGLPGALAVEEIWTSPHNLVFQLLAETGLAGAVPVVAGLLIWVRRVAGEILRAPEPAIWWVAACAGVGIMHALLEYPLWYAHFLGVTALVMGVGAHHGVQLHRRAARALLAAGAFAGVVALSVTLKDYLRFELASPIAAGRSLAPDAEILGDRAILRELRHGLLAQRVELWLFLALPLDADELAEKIAIGERLLRTWPTSQIASQQSVFLALAGRDAEAVALLKRALATYKNQRERIAGVIAGAPPPARSVLQEAFDRPEK